MTRGNHDKVLDEISARSPELRPNVLMIGAYPDWDMEPLAAVYHLHELWKAENRVRFIEERRGVIRAIATRGELGADRALIEALPRLEIISSYGVGTDAIDLEAARSRGVRVTNAPDVLNGDVADLAIGLTLAVARCIPAGDAYVRSGAWTRANMGLVSRFYGKKLGIVGFGRIGSMIARRASGFDVEIGYFDIAAKPDCPHRFFVDLIDLASWSDFLIVSLAGGAATAKLIGKEVLRALGPQGFLINVSRGSTVDEPALIEALESAMIGGAGLDVFWNEPNIDPRFRSLENVVLQPHHASGTVETRRAMGQIVRDNLAAHFAGRPLITPVA